MLSSVSFGGIVEERDMRAKNAGTGFEGEYPFFENLMMMSTF
jgi:hypothetical protein